MSKVKRLLEKLFNEKYDNNQTRKLNKIEDDNRIFDNVPALDLETIEEARKRIEENDTQLSFNPIFSQGPVYSSIAGTSIDPKTGKKFFEDDSKVLDENGWRKE